MDSVLTSAQPCWSFHGEGFKFAGLLKIDVRACIGTVKARFAMRRRP